MAAIASSLLSVLLVVPLLVSVGPSFTYPRHIAALPRDATHLALDKNSHGIIAFSGNGTHIGRFAPDSQYDFERQVATGP